ncbi:MAG: flagellar assembly protein FliW [Lachnospiraceae bacterium]|nr:flagellar assembly protein FliW [Lachnospiraceae bacterium]MDD7148399.1 flagellar assembly protein FliW [Lachnospiraceae bacterium]
MRIQTKIFGEIDIDEEKILHFANGIIGFPDLKDFALMYDAEKGEKSNIRWLQSLQEPAFAMPVLDPLAVKPDYNPEVEDELLKPIGELNPDEMLVLVTLTVPKDITKMSVNLCAPIVIHTESRKACQIIVDNEKYPVKYMIYDVLQKKKAGE